MRHGSTRDRCSLIIGGADAVETWKPGNRSLPAAVETPAVGWGQTSPSHNVGESAVRERSASR